MISKNKDFAIRRTTGDTSCGAFVFVFQICDVTAGILVGFNFVYAGIVATQIEVFHRRPNIAVCPETQKTFIVIPTILNNIVCLSRENADEVL